MSTFEKQDPVTWKKALTDQQLSALLDGYVVAMVHDEQPLTSDMRLPDIDGGWCLFDALRLASWRLAGTPGASYEEQAAQELPD